MNWYDRVCEQGLTWSLNLIFCNMRSEKIPPPKKKNMAEISKQYPHFTSHIDMMEHYFNFHQSPVVMVKTRRGQIEGLPSQLSKLKRAFI